MKKYFLALAMIILASMGSTAGTKYSSTNGNWNSNTTWVGGVQPSFTDSVVIQSGDNVQTNGSRTCAGITITGTLTMASGEVLTVNGGVGGGGILSGGRTISLTGDWTFNGTSTGSSVAVIFTGSDDQMFSGKISTSSGDLTINKSGGKVTLGSTMYVGGIFTMTAGTFDASTYLLTVVTPTLTAGTLRVGAATWGSNYSFTPTLPAGFTIDYYNAAATINAGITYKNLRYSGSGTAGASGDLTIQGNLENTGGGTLNFGANDVTISGTTASHSIAGFTTTGLVSMTKTAGTAVLTGNVNMGSFTLNGLGGALDFGVGLTHTVTGLLTTANGTMDLDACTLYINGSTNAYGGVANMATSTVSYGGGAQTIIPTTYHSLLLAGTGVKSMGYAVGVGGDLTINSGVTLLTNDNSLALGGNFINNGTLTAGASAITLTGSLDQSLNGVTTAGPLLVAKDGGTATFNGNVTADSLTFSGNNATVALNPGVVMTLAKGLSIPRPTLAANTLAVGAGTLTCGPIALGGTLVGVLNSVLTVSTGTVNLTGNLTSAGPASQLTFTGAGTLNITGNFMSGTQGTFTPSTSTVKFNAAGAQTVAPFAYTFNNVTLLGSGIKTLANATINGVLSMEGTATASGAPTFGAAGTLRYNKSGSSTAGSEWVTPFTGSGGVVVANTGAVTLNAARVMNATAPLTINSGATLATGNYQLTFNGDFLNSGTFNAGSSTITIAGTAATQSISGFTTTGLVSLTKTSGTATFTSAVNGGAFTLNGSGGTLNLGTGLTHTFTGTLTRTAGTLDCNTSTLNIAGAISGTTGSWTPGTSTVNFTGAGAQTIPGVSYYDLGFSGAGTKTIDAGTTVTVNRNWAVGSAVTMTTTANATVAGNITGSGSITSGSGTITIGGNWTNNGVFTKGTGTVAYNGTAGQTVGALNYNNLTASGAGMKTPAGAVTVGGVFTNSSVVDMAGNALTLSGTNDNTGGTLKFSGASNGVAVAAGTVEYYGAGQTIGTGTYNNLTINQSGGGATLGGGVTVNGVLTLTSGVVSTGANTLTLGSSGSISGAGAAKYINGNLSKPFSSGSLSYTFPVGDASVYAPVTVAFGSISTGGTLTAKTISGQHGSIASSGINTAKDVNRYFTLTNSGIVFDSYSPTFNFAAGDVIGGAQTASFVVRRYAASAWNTAAVGTRTATSTQATGLTTFGDFAIGNQQIDHYVVSAASPQTAGGGFASSVEAQDVLNQTVTDDNSTVVTMSSSGAAQFDSNGDGTFGDNTKTLTGGTFSIQTKDNTAQTMNVTATDGGGKTGTRSGIVVNPAAANLAQSVVTASPSSITANGASTSAITVQLKDAFGNNLISSGGTVALSATKGTVGAVTDNGNGTYSAVFTSPTTTGSATISGTLDAGPLTSTATVSLTPGPASLAQSTVTASQTSLTADGSSTSTITVRLKDAFGNNLTASGGTVALSTTAGTLGSVTDNNNGTYTAVLTAPTLVGSASISGTLNSSALVQTAAVSFTPGGATTAQSVISASPSSITANGSSTSTVTVQLKDAFGNNLVSSGGTVALSTTAGTLGSITNNNNGTYNATLTAPTLAGSATISGTLNGSGITSTTIVAFTPGPASLSTSTITTSPASITANGITTSTITVQLKDAFNNNLTASGGTVALSTTGGTLGGVTDNNNGTYTATLTSPTSVGSATISGTLNSSALSSTAGVTFTPGAASLAQSTISASLASITANGVSTSTITVQLKDAYGNNLTAGSGTVALSTTAGTLGSVTDNNNGSYTAILTSPTLVGSATISGTLNSSALTQTAAISFTPGAATTAQSVITASPSSITANGLSTSTITVQLKDAFGNNLTSNGGTVALSTTGGALGSVTDNNNGTYTATLTSSTAAGNATISGTLNGSTITSTVLVSFVPGTATTAQSTISASPSSITANGVSTSTVTVQLKDAHGNNLTASGGTVALSATAGLLGGVTDHNNGRYTATLTSPTAAGSATISGTLNGTAITSTSVVTFTPGSASLTTSTITAAPGSITANGSSTSTITVQLKDAFNNNLTASAGTVAFSTTAGTLGSVTDHNNGMYSAVLTSPTTVGSATVSATLNGSGLTSTATVTFTVGAASLAQSTVTASSTSITANGTSTSTITVRLKDAFNNNLSASGGTVALSTTRGTLGSVTDNNDGTYTAVLTSSTAAGSATVSGTLNGAAFSSTAAVAFVPGTATLAQSTVSASPASVTANGSSTSTVTVQLKDAHGNNLTQSGGTVALSATVGSLGSVTDNTNGSYSAVFTSPTTAGEASISATLNGSPISSTATITLTAGAVSTVQSTISASPASITANGSSTSTITVRLKDAFGNNLTTSGGTVALSASVGSLGSVTDHADGSYTAVLSSATSAGTATVSGTLNGSSLSATASVVFAPGAASVAQSTLSASPASVTANGTATSSVTVQLKDSFGNNLPSSGGTVVLATTAGILGGVTDNNNGTYSATLTSPTSVGSATITGTLGGVAITDDATVTFTPGAVSTAHTVITASPVSITADGSSTSTITVQLKDVHDNNLTAASGTVVLNTTAGTLSAVTNNNNGTYTAVLTSPTTVGSATVSGTLDGSAIVSTASVSFVPGAASLAQTTITASPASITANGASTSTVTVQLKDAHNNNLSASGGTVALSTTAGALGTVTDNNNGTYTAVLTSSTTTGSAVISGMLNGSAIISTTSVTFAVGAASVAQSVISASPVSITANGSSTSTVNVQLKDAFGNNLTASGGTVVLSSTAGTLGTVTDHNNGTYSAVLTSPTTIGSATISGTLNGTALSSTAAVTFTVGAASTAQSTISASPGSITANGTSTSTITVQLKDAFNNNLTASGGVVALSATKGTLGSVTDHNNGTYTAVLTSPTVTGSATVTGTLGGSALTDDAVVTFTVGAASIAQSTITASPASITADGVSTSTVTVQLRDAFGNNLVASGGTVALNATAGTLGSVTDHANGTYSAVLTAPTTAGGATISGTLGGSAITSTANVTFTVGAANTAHSTITASSVSLTADGSSTTTITVQLKDVNNNNLTTSGGVVVLSTTAGTLGSVTDHNNGSYSAVLTAPTTVGSATITGTLGSVAITDDATVQFTVGAASAALSTITASPASITADGASTSTITVQLKDANGNNLTSSGGTIALSATAGTLGSVTDNNNGTYTAVLTSATTAGGGVISGTLNSSSITSTAVVSFVPGTASLAQSTIAASPASLTADGSGTSTITVQLKDAHGNNLGQSGGTVVISSTAGTLGAVTDHANGTYSAVLTAPTTAGGATISATLNGSALVSTGSITFTAGAASVAQSTITASPASITANGSSTSTVTIQLKDGFGNNLTSSGGTVALSTTSGTLGSVTDHSNGTYSATLTSPTSAGSATITGTLNGSAFTSNASVTFTAGEASVAHSSISASPASLTANGSDTTTITVQLKDANNNNLTSSGGTVVIYTTAGTLGSVTDHNNGSYSVVLTAPVTVGSAAITARLNGSLLTANATVSFAPGSANVEHAVVSASPRSITADGASASTITVQLKDVNNNNLVSSGGTVAVYTTAGTLGSVTDNNNGSYTAVLTSSTTLGTAVVSARLNGTLLTSTDSVSFAVGAASAAHSVIALSADTLSADGVSTATVTVQLKDAFDHHLTTSGGTVVITATAGTMGSVTDHNNGTYTAILTSPTLAGSATIHAALNDSTLVSAAAMTFTPTTVTITGNAGVPGATVSWTDGMDKTATADSSGNYTIVVSYKWSGTVTVTHTGFTFSPATKTYELVAADHTGQNFTGAAITYTISGNAGAGGAQLAWTDGNAKTATADSTGAYAITVSYNWSGVVRPSLTGYMFAPESTAYTNVLEAKTAQNYTAVPYVYANVKVFLAGPFSAGAMTTGLSTTKRLPLTSETGYAAATFGYTAKTVDSLPPVGIVDWVLVELRTGTAGATKAAVQAGFLRSNGQIVDTNGTGMLLFKGVQAGNYYIVIRHRNHLSVMSAAPVAMSASGTLYNFTDNLSKAYGTNPMMALTGGYFGMWAGDVNRNGNVKFTGSQNDRSALLIAIGVTDPMIMISGYLQADVNLDGIAKFTGSSNDNTIILRTPGFADPLRVVFTQVPN